MTDLDRALELTRLAYERRRYNHLAFFKPYPKQLEFIKLHGSVTEAALFAGNQVGKSDTGAYITACHATGRYPKDWEGWRITKPNPRIWVAGPSGMAVRDIEQRKLFGAPGIKDELGTGMVPRDCIIKTSPSRSAADAIDTVLIKNERGGMTSLSFKTYDQARYVWQGEPVDFIWDDEESPLDLYAEAQARTMAVKGRIICTFTPLEGLTMIAKTFIEDSNEHRAWMRMEMLDALHFGPDDVEDMKRRYQQHEWDARIYGLPKMGEGRAFTADESMIRWVPGVIPKEWFKIAGVDFGMNHPFAYVVCAWDRDTDTFYVLNGFRIKSELVIQHAKRIRDMAGNVPTAWPHDGHVRDRQSGDTFASIYRREGVLMLADHAKNSDGTRPSLHGSVSEMNEWMNAGRFRVASHLSDWFTEYGNYHYKDGKINPIDDDLISATRYAWMMRRSGKAVDVMPAGPIKPERHRPIVNFDLHTGKPFPEWDPRRYG